MTAQSCWPTDKSLKGRHMSGAEEMPILISLRIASSLSSCTWEMTATSSFHLKGVASYPKRPLSSKVLPEPDGPTIRPIAYSLGTSAIAAIWNGTLRMHPSVSGSSSSGRNCLYTYLTCSSNSTLETRWRSLLKASVLHALHSQSSWSAGMQFCGLSKHNGCSTYGTSPLARHREQITSSPPVYR